jgi:hypothetical protein
MGGIQREPQQLRKCKNNKAGENKHDGERNNVGMFKRPNQKDVHADK